MDTSTKRWSILVACCFINLCIGSMYAWSVFSAPMADYLNQLHGSHLTGADLAIVFIVCNSVGPITMITGGKINDTFGPKTVIFIGGLMFGGGMFLCGMATEVKHLVWAYGLLTGLGLGMVYGATISTCIKYFPDKRGLVGGLTTAIFGISSVILPPIASLITENMGVIASFKIIGAAFIIIVCGSAFFISKCPDNYKPAGWNPDANKAKGSKTVDKNWRQMLASPMFYVLIVMLTSGAVAGMMCIALAAPMAQRMIGMSTAAATAVVSTLALFNVCGRVVAGWLSDRIGRNNTLALALLFTMFGLYSLYISGEGDITSFYIGICLVGGCFGAFMGVFPGFTTDQFGTRHNSVNFGIMFIGFAIAGYTGPTIMHSILTSTGSFKTSFLIGIAFSFVGLVLSFVYRALNNRAQLQLNYKTQ